ncbi:histidine-phosphotransfer domain, HPT domain-containing protein [Calocera viscosa TUFC12733]|uniref:Histidine-phosphotransfer domain, HPT domain-containing protein n=1 Tax=Calocera viscosa (strain TUFC12733) TaxID=1330018 RepID=A0A167RVF1_CALVF|nr:histidine-phosphotransfer domain, HPT domain-containing protein [Calocera viscosa TUFC12733]
MASSSAPAKEKSTKEQAVGTEKVSNSKVDGAVKNSKEEPAASTSSGALAKAATEPVREEAEGGSDPEAPVPVIDMDTFSQILEMDDDDTHEFSLSIVENYMEQAEATFDSMSAALDDENLPELSRLGHFLKGSSAALGISQVQTGCEAMQYYGQLRRGANGAKIEAKEAIELITPLLAKIKEGHAEADKWLRDFYGVESWGTPEEE